MISVDLSWLGRSVEVTIDRPLGSTHPEHPDLVYGVNYGFVAGTVAGDGEPVDAYVLGVDGPVGTVVGTVVAVIERTDDVEDKLVVAVAGSGPWPAEAITEAVRFQEQWFHFRVHTSAPWTGGAGVVELPDGCRIRGRGLRDPLPPGPRPEFGVYLLGRDPGPFDWEHRWVRWPDFRAPASTADAMAALRQAHERSAAQRVEVACRGGVGRTGTALAAVAVLAGVPPADAVTWVRRHYHRRAIETPWQRRWVADQAK
ncbi:MAG TPA: protein-tyrosine phosphatase family protein [Acidimicrobiales bacterium]|nr:protein-tyrosine phosphatase family protein [Acidimicrobiales bacterium]